MASPPTTHATATTSSSSTGHPHMDRLSDDLVAEIMFRLPSACVLTCRAVCRAWRRITTSPVFLAADARRRPLELVLRGPAGALYAIPLADLDDETQKRCLLPLWCGPESHPPPSSSDGGGGGGLVLLGSCDGLLLFERGSHGFSFLVCDPARRRWITLPRPAGRTRPCGMYVHAPSGEHRLLYLANDGDYSSPAAAAARRPGTAAAAAASHYVLTLSGGASRARRLGLAAATRFVEFYTVLPEPYLRHRGSLHWLRHPDVYETGKILAFDTETETFRRVSRPPPLADPDVNHQEPFLLETDGALTVAAVLYDGSMDVDLWALQDYDDDASWTRRARVRMPSPASWIMSVGGVLGRQNVIAVKTSLHETVQDRLKSNFGAVLYDLTEKKVLRRTNFASWSVATSPTEFLFKDRLERHAFFDQQQPNS